MKKYVAVYHATAEKMAEWMHAPKDEQVLGMEEWKQWAERHKEELVELGAPLGKNKRVSSRGVSDESTTICGYSIVEADSHESAVAIFSDNPHVKEEGAWIDVLEWVEMEM